MFIAACAPQASGFDTQRGRWAFAGDSGKARCTPPFTAPPQFSQEKANSTGHRSPLLLGKRFFQFGGDKPESITEGQLG